MEKYIDEDMKDLIQRAKKELSPDQKDLIGSIFHKIIINYGKKSMKSKKESSKTYMSGAMEGANSCYKAILGLEDDYVNDKPRE